MNTIEPGAGVIGAVLEDLPADAHWHHGLFLGKNRHGPQTRILVVWDHTTLRVSEESQDCLEINPEDRVA
jgi:hypothetical protein